VSGVSPERWSQLWHTATNAAPPTNAFPRLVALYSEPQRHYHTLLHIEDCLGEFDRAKQLATDPAAVELAIWFHDAVYDPRAADNEERSAELAKDWLSDVHASDALTDSVGRLVLATKNHEASLHADAALLVDVDLSILGKPPGQFWQYERQIREEYAWVEKPVFAAKRAEILRRFLARERIYQTEIFFHRMEAQARANLQAAVQRLSDGLSS